MKKNLIYSSVIAATFGLALTGCGGDDKGLMDKPNPPTPPTPPPVTESLRAFPQAMILSQGDKQLVNLTGSVEAVGIDSWSLSNVTDNNGFGTILNETAHSFDYLAHTAGMTTLPYEVQGGGKTAKSQILVAINAKQTGPTDPDKVNTVPTAGNITLSTLNNKNATTNLADHIFDADGDALKIAQLVDASGRFSLGADGYTLTFTPNGFVGVDQAMYSVEDGQGGYAIAYVVVNSKDANPVKPNTAPVAKNLDKNIDSNINTVWKLDLAKLGLISDADGDALTIAHIFDGNGRAVKAGATTIDYTPGNFTGVDQFTYVITDGKKDYAAATISLTVSNSTPANAVPVAKPITISNVNDNDTAPIGIDLSGYVSDADNDALRIVSVMGANGTVVVNANNPLEIDYTPPSPVQGLEDKFTYVVTDGKGGYAMSMVKVEMVAHNPNPPVANIAEMTTLYNKVLTINLDDFISDAETANANLTISDLKIKDPVSSSKATVTLAGKTITYTPNDFTGVEVLTYTVSDGELSTQGIVVITVNPDNTHTLTANNFAIDIDAGSANNPINWLPQVSSDEASGNTFSLVSVIDGSLGTATVTNGHITYTPTAGKYGEDKLVYTVKDSHNPAHYAQGVVTITINPPVAPTITALTMDGTPTIDSTLTAQVTCDRCNPANYQYQWIINGLTAATTPTYSYEAADAGFNIRLEVKGIDDYQQTSSAYSVYSISKVEKIYSNDMTFAALKTDGSVVTLGGGSNSFAPPSVTDANSGVQAIYASSGAFAALKADGAVVTWGIRSYGSDAPVSVTAPNSGVQSIYSNEANFAAVKADGSVVAWGSGASGNNAPTSVTDTGSNVQTIYSTEKAFAAVKKDGSVIAWGDGTTSQAPASVTSVNSDVQHIYSNNTAFIAVKSDGSLVAWGSAKDAPLSVTAINSGVRAVFLTSAYAYAAIKIDGSVVAWGSNDGGKAPVSVTDANSGVQTIASTERAFAAVKADGSIVAWGNSSFGATPPASVTDENSNVQDLFSNKFAFAALKADGSVVAWGAFGFHSTIPSGVRTIFSNDGAFVALKTDGSVVAWGGESQGGAIAPHSVTMKNAGVIAITPNISSFAALKNDGSVVAWGRVRISPIQEEQLKPSFNMISTSIE